MKRATSFVTAVFIGGLSPALVGCEADSTGVERGRAEAFVEDEPGTAGSAMSAAVRPHLAMRGQLALAAHPTASELSGTAAGDFQASISGDGETWVELGSPNGITVVLQAPGARTTVHGEQDAPSGTYRHARLVLRDVEITVDAGSTVEGTTLDDDAKLSLATGSALVIERPLSPVALEPGSTLEIVFDLNSKSWLTAEALASGVVSASAVEASVTASARKR